MSSEYKLRECDDPSYSLYEVTARETDYGMPAWYLVKVHKDKKQEFEAAISKGSLDLSNYGEVIESGFRTTL